MFDLMLTPEGFGWDIKIVQISIFWLNIVTWYVLVMIWVIPKMDLGVGEMGFIFYGEHPVLVTRTRVSDPGPMGPLVCYIFLTEALDN